MPKNKNATIGHNSGVVSNEQLKQIIVRIERMNEEIAASIQDRKEIYFEAKSAGFDVKTIRQVIKLRAMDSSQRAEQEELVSLYMGALTGTPLGDYAVSKNK
jgi:uncharacterized protein (UPF0335 family)